MKLAHFCLFFLFIIAFVSSCKKDSVPIVNNASLNVINSGIGIGSIYVNRSGSSIEYYTYADSIKYGTNEVYTLISGDAPIGITAKNDSTNILFSGNIRLESGGIYSLFLGGQSHISDTLFVKDNIPYLADSLIGVRVVNLSPNSSSLSINVQNVATPIVSSLGYKGISGFQTLTAIKPITKYVFEARDLGGNLLASFTLNFKVFRCYTLVVGGLKGATGVNGLNIFSVSNF